MKILMVALLFLLPSAAFAADAKTKPTLKYATSYKEAIDAARERNTFVFATFHKDH